MEYYQASLSDVEKVSELFDQYRQFYDQEEDRKGAYDFIKSRIINQESIILLLRIMNVLLVLFSCIQPLHRFR
ncbi:hypothetical protein [Alkalihalobacillus sp. MEB130]|uniref:hypothetical protein n=1 Tax=Alkalihalobacillus sp. MEB130 TaxID=2976704 RepID=UPI0028E88DAC|nr:hypothetical protein [Alkalihalobacillus sp. MEB130]